MFNQEITTKPNNKTVINTPIKIIFNQENFPAEYNQWTSKKIVVLKSSAGGVEQQVHKDFPDFEICQGLGRENNSVAKRNMSVSTGQENSVVGRRMSGAMD